MHQRLDALPFGERINGWTLERPGSTVVWQMAHELQQRLRALAFMLGSEMGPLPTPAISG